MKLRAEPGTLLLTAREIGGERAGRLDGQKKPESSMREVSGR